MDNLIISALLFALVLIVFCLGNKFIRSWWIEVNLEILNADIIEYQCTANQDGYIQRKYIEYCELATYKVRRYLGKKAAEHNDHLTSAIIPVTEAEYFGWVIDKGSLFFWAWPNDPGCNEEPIRYQLDNPPDEIQELFAKLLLIQSFAEKHGVEEGLLN